MEQENDAPSCPICFKLIKSNTDTRDLNQNTLSTLQFASDRRGDNKQFYIGQVVEIECYRNYTRGSSIVSVENKRSLDGNDSSPKKLRSTYDIFDYKKCCYYCGHEITSRVRYAKQYSNSSIIEVRKLLLKIADDRKDNWATLVTGRLQAIADLPAADGIYHHVCDSSYRTGRNIPSKYASSQPANVEKSPHLQKNATISTPKHGRKINTIKKDAFDKVKTYLEDNDDETNTLLNLVEKMKEFLADDGVEPYTTKYMQEMLETEYGDNILITKLTGLSNVVTLHRNAEKIVQEFHSANAKKLSFIDEKHQIIKVAAKLIKEDIKSIKKNSEYYPTSSEMSVDESYDFLPSTLQIFLKEVFVEKNNTVKMAFIGQSVMQAARPRALLCPLLFGLSSDFHNHFQSRYAVDLLYKAGFGTSYSNVQNYERSAAVCKGTTLEDGTVSENHCIQYIGDNADYNSRTLDGHNTLHAMGIIATISPSIHTVTRVPKIKVSDKEIQKAGAIDISSFFPEVMLAPKEKYGTLPTFTYVDSSKYVNLLWKSSLLFCSPRPAWQGLMQNIHKCENPPGKSSVIFLPMIDLNPNDMNCMHSTLTFISNHAQKHKVTPVVTFDQPLYWNAKLVKANSDINNIVIRLGGFHTLMSFLGSIGHTMAGAGLSEALQVVYAKNTVEHISSGKAVSRAIRGHLLVISALYTLIIMLVYVDTEAHIDYEKISVDHPDIMLLKDVYAKLVSGEISIADLQSDQAILNLHDAVENKLASLNTSRTAKLWLQYMDMVDIAMDFIYAERTAEKFTWKMHLATLRKMEPYFASCGHNNYAKSVYLYLEDMAALEEDHPEVYKFFQDGHYAIRRSDHHWDGIWTDMIIEQCLMRSLKTSGGLTRGRGVSEVCGVL